MPFTPEEINFVDIFPPINVARAGDSEDSYLGPEIPGVEPIPEKGFKDSQHRIKKLAARYRVYAYDKDSKVLGEIDTKDYNITWKVHVANKKCAWVLFRGQYEEETMTLRNKDVDSWPEGVEKKEYAYTDERHNLIIDPKEQTVTGPSADPVPLVGQIKWKNPTYTDVRLGDIRTDELGHLIVHAGSGHSQSLTGEPHQDLNGEFDSDHWFDSMCDGTVRVVVQSKKSPKLPITVKNRATIITAPPKFTSGLHCPTTLYDLIEDVYERPRRKELGDKYDVGDVEFYRDIYPMFHRMYLNSWTNFRANEGHGPRKAAFFLENADLYNPNAGEDGIKARKYIMGRIRAPVKKGDKENEKLRDEQTYMYYMPRLGGNNSDMPEDSEEAKNANDRNRWASLTELQYDRLAKWAKGDFTTGKRIVPYKKFEDIPLAEQPDALTYAAIEWSVGAPLYPGIECYWIAEFDHMYKPDARFRFSDTVLPGHLTRGLALPWQSDFYMCNTHWWPSIRPDNVVTEADFATTSSNFREEPSKILLNLTKRTLWDRGLDRDPTGESDILGNSEMVRHWTKLGFIAEHKYGPGQLNSAHIETERKADFPPA